MLTLAIPGVSDGVIPRRYSGRGEDLSPAVSIGGIPDGTASFAMLMQDISHPLFRDFPHWVVWDLPVVEALPEGISHGRCVEVLGVAAFQGVAYGLHRYRGPKPPPGRQHSYRFTLMALDARLGLSPFTGAKGLLRAAQGHLLEKEVWEGRFPGGEASAL